MQKGNGLQIYCPVSDDWVVHKQELHDDMRTIAQNSLKTAEILDKLETKLVNAATGKNHVPISVVLILVSFMGICLLGAVYKDSNMDIKLPWGGEINQSKGHIQ